MNIIDFECVESLFEEIKSDKKTNNILSRRFPIRLIFLQRFETLRLLSEFFLKHNIELLNIEDELPKPDGWITKDALVEIVSSLKNDTAIIPFSEIVRFYSGPDFRNFFNRLFLIENSVDNLNKRIYLPLIGIEQRFEIDFYQNFSRRNESAPIWGVTKETPNSIKLLISNSQNPLKVGDYEVIENTKEWLKFWKKRSPCDVICYSKPLNLFFKNTLPDTIFTIEQISNLKDLIFKVFNKEIPIPYIKEESSFWDKLLVTKINECDNFRNFVQEYFGVTTITEKTILDIWFKTDKIFDKWLLKNFILSQDCLKHKYIYQVFESITDYSDLALLKNLYLQIFSKEMNSESLSDRYELIKQFSNLKPVQLTDEVIYEIESSLKSCEDKNKVLLLTTGLLEAEKKLILELFANNQITNFDLTAQRFPDFDNYLSMSTFENLKEGQEWIYEYLQEYKKSKLVNHVTSKLIELLSGLNKDQNSFYTWYHGFQSIHSIIHSFKVDKVIWVDALGIEWVSYIEKYLAHKRTDLKTFRNYLAVSNLPSSTEHNKILGARSIKDFDQFIHSNSYSYPKSIIDEFKILKNILDTNLILDQNQTIAIVSDHGLTALSRLFGSKKYGKEDSHEGRFVKVNSSDHIEDTDYLIHRSEIDNSYYLISLKHNSLGKKPLREAHGGCTPEEVFVPLILISNIEETISALYSISVVSSDIRRNESIIIEISPKPRAAEIEIASKIQPLKYNALDKKWTASIDKSLVGQVKIKVIVETTIVSFSINIISGIKEEELF